MYPDTKRHNGTLLGRDVPSKSNIKTIKDHLLIFGGKAEDISLFLLAVRTDVGTALAD